MLAEPSLIQRKHPLAKCEDCPWYERSGFADASGPTDAKTVIVGEAPGRDECKTGKPFTGPSGRLLDRVLTHHGLDRDSIRFTNVVACHPRFVSGQKPTAPPKEVVSACQPRLQSELRDRESIICLGNTAKEAILETREPITRVRQGPPRTSPNYPNSSIIATIHPAACLRSSDNFPSLVRDLGKLKSAKAYINWEPPIYKVYDDVPSASAVVDELLNSHRGYVTLDIEVGVEKDTSFTHPDSLLCVGIGFAPNRAIVIGENALHSQEVLDKLGHLLSAKEVICQNGKFDIQVLMRLAIVTRPNLWADTMLASYCLDERPGHHSLEGLSSEILGAPAWKAELKPHLGKGKKKNYANVPRPILYRYNAYDTACTYNLWHEHFEKDLEKKGLRSLHDFLVEASNELIYLELEGVAIDEKYLEVIDDEYINLLGILEEGLKGWVDNPRSSQQVLGAAKGMRLPVKSSVDAPTLRAILDRDINVEQREFITKVLEYRREQKLHGTYIKGTRNRLLDGRLYPTFLLHGTVTGRLSCRNPNLQNIPRGSTIKKLFIPQAGNILLQADYKQAEWRAIACLAQDSYLQGALGDPNRDIHGEVARQFFGPNFTKDQRVMAKTFVFGVAYGRGAEAISKAFKVSVYEAERFIKEFFDMVPDVVQWRKDVHEMLFKGGQSLQTPFGRRRRFWLVTRENKHDIEKEALAFLPQSIASDLTLSSLVRMRRTFGTGASAPKIRITVHDSILVEAPKEHKEDVAQEMKFIMENTAADVFSDYVRFPVDIEAGNSWGNLKELV